MNEYRRSSSLSPGHCWVNTVQSEVKRFLFPIKGEKKVHPLILLHCYDIIHLWCSVHSRSYFARWFNSNFWCIHFFFFSLSCLLLPEFVIFTRHHPKLLWMTPRNLVWTCRRVFPFDKNLNWTFFFFFFFILILFIIYLFLLAKSLFKVFLFSNSALVVMPHRLFLASQLWQ